MSGAEPHEEPRRLSNRQRLILGGLWLFAPLLVAVQHFGLRHLDALNAPIQWPHYLGPSWKWIVWGTMSPLGAVTAALALQWRWMRRPWRILGGIGLLVMLPLDALISCMFVWVAGDSSAVQLANGRRFVTSGDDHPNTFLNEEVGPFGLLWRRLDRPMMGSNVRLAASSDDKWLVVLDENYLTTCYKVLPGRVQRCVGIEQGWNVYDEAALRAHSERISKLTGIQP